MRTPSPRPTPPQPGAVLLKRSASATQPDVWRIGEGGSARIWKTFRESPPLLRATVCRWLARREARNLSILSGMEGVPGLLGRPEPWTIEMTCLDAVPVLTSKDGHGLDGSYFDAFAAMLVEMHRRGLNHGDIRRMNLLRDTQTGRPCLVDFAQSFPARGIGALFAPVARRVDRIKFLQLKRWYLGTLPPHELAELKSRPWYMRAGHFLRKRLYRPWKHWRRRG